MASHARKAQIEQDSATACDAIVEIAARVLNREGGDPVVAAVKLADWMTVTIPKDQLVAGFALLAVRAASALPLPRQEGGTNGA